MCVCVCKRENRRKRVVRKGANWPAFSGEQKLLFFLAYSNKRRNAEKSLSRNFLFRDFLLAIIRNDF